MDERGGASGRPVLLTYNRVTIIVFSVLVLAALMLVLRYTSLGLQDARGDAEPAHGRRDGDSDAMGGCDDIRPRLRHCRHGGCRA